MIKLNEEDTLYNKRLLFILILFFCILQILPLYAIDIIDSYNNIKTTFDGLSRFLDAIYSFVSAITNFLGYKAIALFFAIAITSAGLSAIGLPKGKVSFFISMVIINLLWYTWNKSFEIDWTYTLITMLKTNVVVLLPYFLFLLIKNYQENIKTRVVQIIHFILPFLKKGGMSKESFIESIKTLNIAYTDMINALINDYFNSKKTIELSGDSIRTIEQLEKTLQKFKKLEGRK